MILRWIGMIALLMAWPATARAEWLEASSAHFVIYADDSEKDLRRFSDQLERYHAAMAFITDVRGETPSPSNRVNVFVVKSGSEVRRVAGTSNRFVQGFYRPLAGRSMAVVSTVNPGGMKPDFSMIALLHEYAHHFIYTNSTIAQPRWLSEGSAEFFSSASFFPDGSVGLGMPAHHRAHELGNAVQVTVEDLLDPASYARQSHAQYDELYGKSWLLYHYLTFSKERGPHLRHYFDLLAKGTPLREAGLQAFGDFAVLEKELFTYRQKPKIMTFKVPPEVLKVGAVAVRRLSAGEAAMMSVRVRSSAGVNEEQAKQVVADARSIAAKYPGDAAVLTSLAEAEYDAGNDQAAIAAADAAVALDRMQVNAHVQKGYAMFRMAADAKDPEAAYRLARAPFIALNAIEPDHPLPLVWYYRSFAEMGKPPSPVAIEGLQRAVELAPFDMGMRMTLAMQQLRDRQPTQARRNLLPIAFAPHGTGHTKLAQAMLVRLDADPAWDGSGMTIPDKPEEDSAGGAAP